MTYTDLTNEQLTTMIEELRTELERRNVEQANREAVNTTIRAYADSQGLTVLQAWRALAPEGVQIPDDPEPPTVPEFVQPRAGEEYKRGDRVTFEGRVYESTYEPNAWSPPTFPSGWKLLS